MIELVNCSLCDKYECLIELPSNSLCDKALQRLCELLIIFIAATIVYILDVVISTEFKLHRLTLLQTNISSRNLVQIMALSILILCLPLFITLVILALLYKVLCLVAIKRKDRRFVQFLDSFDVFCCLQNNTTTDIQGVIKSNTIELAVDKIKEKLHNVFIKHGADKIFYRRNEEYGFYYWRRYSFIDLAQYVQIEEVTDDSIEHLKRGHNNQVVYNDEGLFKVFIIKNNGVDENEYKIILKFHRSVKDTAVIEFVARLVEKADDCHVHIATAAQTLDYNSPDALIHMITKLFDILAHSFDGSLHSTNSSTLKTLDWTKSDENLLCKVNNVKDMKLVDKFGDHLVRVLDTLER